MKSVSPKTSSNGKLLHVYALKKQAHLTASLAFYFVEWLRFQKLIGQFFEVAGFF